MLQIIRCSFIALVFFTVSAQAQALEQSEIAKFSEENSQMRREHTLKLKELHLKHIAEFYDLKLRHQKELEDLIANLSPNDPGTNKLVKKEFKKKTKEFHAKERQMQEEFRNNVLNALNNEYRQKMKQRHKNLKVKSRIKNSRVSLLQ